MTAEISTMRLDIGDIQVGGFWLAFFGSEQSVPDFNSVFAYSVGLGRIHVRNPLVCKYCTLGRKL